MENQGATESETATEAQLDIREAAQGTTEEHVEATIYDYDSIAARMKEEDCNDAQLQILAMILDQLKEEIPKPPNLRGVNRSQTRKVTAEVNKVLGFIDSGTITRNK